MINMDCDFTGYKLVIAPMLYMVRPGVGEKIEAFVKSGGTFVTTYFSGYADENDLCFLGGFPGPLRKVTGIWAEEIDSLYDQDRNALVPNEKAGLNGDYAVHTFCELIHAETADVLATYKTDFYAGRPALTVNSFGKGRAYYIAARTENRFLEDFYGELISRLGLLKALDADFPEGVTAQLRTDGERQFVFLMNFSEEEKTVTINSTVFNDIITGEEVPSEFMLQPYGVRVIAKTR